MYKFFQLIIVSFLLILFFSCNFRSARNSEANLESKNVGKTKTAVLKKLMGIDESVETQWVTEIPEDSDLTVLTGRIGITGSEPFLNVALYIDDQKSYLLSGNQELMEYLTNQSHEKLTVAGEAYSIENKKWLKVKYVQTN